MRKILLTTTALVALGGVSAASADISVSGKASHNIVSGSGDGYAVDSDSMSTTVDFSISGSSTLDNGMTVSGGLDLHETSASVIDDSGFTVAGDFGTLKFGGYAEDDFGAIAIDVTPDEGNAFTARYSTVLPGDEHIDAADVSLTLPSISGATIMIGMADGATSDADGTMAGIKYTMDAGGMGVTIGYGTSSTGTANTDDSQVALTVTAGDATFMVNSGDTGSYSHSGVAATYALSDTVKLSGYTGTVELDTNSSYEVKDTGVGVAYTVTPGMSISLTSNDWSGKNGTAAQAESGTTTTLALDVTF